MTKEEHMLMIPMFSRINESIGIITDVLKSREILSADDPKAFSHAAHADEQKLLSCAAQARKDYLACARLSGVVIDSSI